MVVTVAAYRFQRAVSLRDRCSSRMIGLHTPSWTLWQVDCNSKETQITQSGASRRTQIDAEGCIEHPPFITPGPFEKGNDFRSGSYDLTEVVPPQPTRWEMSSVPMRNVCVNLRPTAPAGGLRQSAFLFFTALPIPEANTSVALDRQSSLRWIGID